MCVSNISKHIYDKDRDTSFYPFTMKRDLFLLLTMYFLRHLFFWLLSLMVWWVTNNECKRNFIHKEEELRNLDENCLTVTVRGSGAGLPPPHTIISHLYCIHIMKESF